MDFQTDSIDSALIFINTIIKPSKCSPPVRRFYVLRFFLVCFILLKLSPPWILSAQSGTPTPSANQIPGSTGTSTPSTEEAVELDPQLLERQQLDLQVERYLNQMTDAEKVGQLFLVTFEGNDVGAESPIAELIRDYHIGGVVLSPRNKNFTNEKNSETALSVATLTNQLQALSYAILLPERQALDPELITRLDQRDVLPESLLLPSAPITSTVITETSESTNTSPIRATATPTLTAPDAGLMTPLPLFIAVEQLGDNLPNTALRQGFTELPTQMAIGATWNRDIARAVGEIVGRELHAVGINMLFGPSLDVLSQPQSDAVGRLGIHSFGGNPYWVGQMGKAYISGVHLGANGHVLTIARHFPGQGDSDRLPDREVATIQTTEQELLRSFIPIMQGSPAVTDTNGERSTADGIMSSHMHFSNIQEGSTESITPLSLDVDTLNRLLRQEPFTEWREDGLLVSNSLGVPAIRRFYDPTLEQFRHNGIALDTLNAGHDLLYLDNFSLDGTWESQRQNIIETILFFRTRYMEDVGTKTKIDDAVRRIIRTKLRMYNATEAQDLQPNESEISASANLTATQSATTTVIATAGITATDSISATDIITQSLEEGLGDEQIEQSSETDEELPPSRVVLLSQVLVSETDLVALSPELQAEANDVINRAALQSLTILHPEDPNQLPDAPNDKDKILIFTDSRLQFECDECTAEAAVGPDMLGKIMDDLYGIDATAQLTGNQIESRTFAQLSLLLDERELAALELEATEQPLITTTVAITLTEETPPEIDTLDDETTTAGATNNSTVTDNAETPVPFTTSETSQDLGVNDKLARQIEEATWIIFVMLDIDTDTAPNSNVVKRFLSQSDIEFSGKKVVVIGLAGPYYLDATEVSQLSLYLGVYSKIQPFLRTSVQALFKAFAPQGAPPVSVPGTQFSNLVERLQPDPLRPLNIEVFLDGIKIAPVDEEAEEGNGTMLQIGQEIRLQVGPILDQNGKQVPDGTKVDFVILYEGEDSAQFVDPILTRNGFATHNTTLEQGGTLLISAKSGEGERTAFSRQISLAIETAEIAEVPPEAIATIRADSPISPTVTTNEEAGTQEIPPLTNHRIDMATLGVALLTILISISLLLIIQVRVLPRDELVRHLLWATIVGLLAYILYGVGLLPGADWLQIRAYPWGTAIIVFIGMLLPVLWLQLRVE